MILGIRPTDFEHADAAPGPPAHARQVDVVEDLGAENHLIFAIDAPRVSAEAVRAAADLAADDEGTLFATTSGRSSPPSWTRSGRRTPGSEVELAVDHARLHFFDPATGHVVDAERQAVASA